MSLTNKAERVKAILLGIQRDRQRYRELKGVLEQQREAMVGRNTTALMQVNEQLKSAYQSLESSSAERNALLGELGIPANAQGMQFLLTRLPESYQEKSRALWEELEHYANECQALNERNGALLNTQIDILQSLLNDNDESDFIYTR